MNLTADADTNYYLFGCFNNSNTNEDSFWIKTNDGDFELYDNLTNGGWEWLELKSLNLTAGEHTISVAFAKMEQGLISLLLKIHRDHRLM